MSKPEITKHWEFALHNALARLQTLIWRFHELQEESQFTAVGAQGPDEMFSIIDGFLGETQWLDRMDTRLLERLKESLLRHVTPAYESGRGAAAKIWSSAPIDDQRKLLKTDDDVILSKAQNRLAKMKLEKRSDRAWFIEGFFLQWRDETLAFLARHGADS
jgi:hypothetical protein